MVSSKILQARHVSAGLPSQQSAADFYILHLKIQIQVTTGLLIAKTMKTQTSLMAATPPQTTFLLPHKYDSQIKSRLCCWKWNIHSQIYPLITALRLPAPSPPIPRNRSKLTFRLWCDILSSLHSPPELHSQPAAISRLHRGPPKWRETRLPWGLSECLPEITLTQKSLL